MESLEKQPFSYLWIDRVTIGATFLGLFRRESTVLVNLVNLDIET